VSVPTLILATRRSALAQRQSLWVKDALERRVAGTRVELLTLGTTGDRMRDTPLPQIGGKGLFTLELEEALLDGRAHFAVHSLKDLPTELADGLVLAAIPVREDVRDALISRDGKLFAQFPDGARVGTSSMRRAAQLRRLRPDITVEPMRGNLDTRLRKLREGPLDAIVLAAAGLHRMGWADQITEYFPEHILVPAVGQGALGIEARADDTSTLAALAALEESWARISATAERSLLRHLGGGCQIPIAAYARRENDGMTLDAIVILPDGTRLIQAKEFSKTTTVDDAERLGQRAAESLLRQGAKQILDSIPPARTVESP
jgi:hydroxymethylbilane synthase